MNKKEKSVLEKYAVWRGWTDYNTIKPNDYYSAGCSACGEPDGPSGCGACGIL